MSDRQHDNKDLAVSNVIDLYAKIIRAAQEKELGQLDPVAASILALAASVRP